MQSNSESPSTPQPTSPNNTAQATPTTKPPVVAAPNWPEPAPTDSPKDFINRLLVGNTPPEATVKAPDQTPIPPAQLPKEPEPKFDFNKKAEPKQEEKKPETKPEKLLDTEENIPDGEPGTLSANYKLLRTTYKETKQTLQKTAEEKAKLEKELEDYKTGAVVPTIIQEKENEIARLQTYERLVNVKATKAYKEQVIEPLKQKQTELAQLFKDYDIPESEAQKFSALTNQADRNRYLSEHFDSRGADQAERILREGRALKEKANQLEQGSKTALQQLEEEHQRIEEDREMRRRDTIASNAKDCWVRALYKIRSENQIKEVIPKVNDPEFNEKIVNPILTAASVEYGKYITMLAESGITELSPEVAEYTARMTILGMTSAIAQQTRDAALQHAQEAEASNRVTNQLLRPIIGGGIPARAGNGVQAPAPTMNDRIDQLLNPILARG